VLARGLRAAGIDFWFDMNAGEGGGLQAGDKFDAKIRSCIQCCSLFVVVLSRNTEARLEGYFRREWRYALERGLEFADNVPFIVPVAVDETGEFPSLPPGLGAVHRVALPAGEVTEEFVKRLRTRVGA
jgi:hypothetical protein